MAGFLQGYVALAGDEGAGGCFDDVVGDGVELVDLQDASDLGEEAFEDAEVTAGDAFDRGDGLRVGEVFGVEGVDVMAWWRVSVIAQWRCRRGQVSAVVRRSSR